MKLTKRYLDKMHKFLSDNIHTQTIYQKGLEILNEIEVGIASDKEQSYNEGYKKGYENGQEDTERIYQIGAE